MVNTHAVYIWCIIIESCTRNLFDFINHCHLYNFNKKCGFWHQLQTLGGLEWGLRICMFNWLKGALHTQLSEHDWFGFLIFLCSRALRGLIAKGSREGQVFALHDFFSTWLFNSPFINVHAIECDWGFLLKACTTVALGIWNHDTILRPQAIFRDFSAPENGSSFS